jgi:hypothetical protein
MTITSIQYSSTLTVLRVDATDIDGVAGLTSWMEEGVAGLVEELVAAARSNRRVAIDVRTPATPGADGAAEAIVQAARGLAQAYTLESGAAVPPVNVIVSTAAQESDRDATWRFLADTDGGGARGATIDLREASR